MLKTLQWYIARELLKTFLLAAVGLTLVFSLCGGLLNMLQAEVLSAVQIMRILMFMLPVAMTLMLPVAALFACAIVYGRFASDNEFDACKASGINIHRLLAPAMGLSVLTAAFTFSFSNFVIPRCVEQLDALVRADIQKIITQGLKSRGYLKYAGYVVHAVPVVDPNAKPADGRTIILQDAAFLMLDKGRLARCGTAEQVDVNFSSGPSDDAQMVEAEMYGVVALDLTLNRLHQQAVQPFSPTELPKLINQNPKWLNLYDLIKYIEQPELFGKVKSGVANVRLMVREGRFYRYAVAQLTSPRKLLVLQDKNRRYEVRAASVTNGEDDYRPELQDAVIIETWEGNRRREYRAQRATLKLKRGLPNMPDVVHMTLSGRVRFVDSLDPEKVNEPKQQNLEEVAAPADVLAQENNVTEADLLGITPAERASLRYDQLAGKTPVPMDMGSNLRDARKRLLLEVALTGMRLTSEIHSRVAFSASTLVLLVLGAGLAIVFRGGQLLTAFVISFTPGMLIVVLNIMGRQMAEKPPTFLVGLGVIWSGILLLMIADAVVLTRWLRR